MITWLTHESEAIRGFPLAGDHRREFPIYLPPAYDAKRADPYPVIFVLAGFARRGAKYIANDSVFSVSLPERLDRAISANKMPASIVVFPDGTTPFGSSQYINSAATGHFMDYIADELTQFIDQQFNTRAEAAGRGVIGFSSGGYGALMLAMLRSDRFSAITSLAGDTFFEVSLLPLVTHAVAELNRAGGMDAFIKKFFAEPNPASASFGVFHTMLVLCIAGCLAPNLANPPLYGDLFFDIETGAIIDEVWQRYGQCDPLKIVDQHIPALQSLRSLTLAAGDQDDHGLQLGHRQFSKKLSQYGVQHTWQEFPARHSGYDWRLADYIAEMVAVLI